MLFDFFFLERVREEREKERERENFNIYLFFLNSQQTQHLRLYVVLRIEPGPHAC